MMRGILQKPSAGAPSWLVWVSGRRVKSCGAMLAICPSDFRFGLRRRTALARALLYEPPPAWARRCGAAYGTPRPVQAGWDRLFQGD
jgi:hypothetical protein